MVACILTSSFADVCLFDSKVQFYLSLSLSILKPNTQLDLTVRRACCFQPDRHQLIFRFLPLCFFTYFSNRFDVRGYLNSVELQKYEAKFGIDYREQLTREEAEIEQELDKERYRDLYPVDALPDEHDEELRRLKESIEEDEEDKKYSNQIQFDYNQLEPNKAEDTTGIRSSALDGAADSEEPFVLPDGLVLPDHLQPPANMKEHNLIEKTARFINKQGGQMEILLKAKQSYNSQFDFLGKYYLLSSRQLVMA